MIKILDQRGLSNIITALTAVAFYHCLATTFQIKINPLQYLIPFGFTFIGYTLIRKMDENRSLTKMEWIQIILLSPFIILFITFPPTTINQWLAGSFAIVLSTAYILPSKKIRLRDYWWSKSITITLVWFFFIGSFLLPINWFQIHYQNNYLLLQLLLMLLLSCWVYDIQESNWSTRKIKNVKYFALIILLLITILNVTLSKNKGMIILLFLLYGIHIMRLKKEYHPVQNILIDVYLGLILFFIT